MELSSIADLILNAGLLGGLIVAIWAFVTGRLWPKEMVDKTLEAQQRAAEASAQIISQTICDKLANGVADGMERGIAKGYLKINGDS